MGFKIVERFNDMTVKQKYFFQLALLNENSKLEKSDYQKAKEIVDRRR